MDEKTLTLETHFIKNNEFKTVYGSGVYGGFTPAGMLSMYFYTERIPIPIRTTLKQNPASPEQFEEVEREAKSGLVREVQVGVLIDLDTAQSMMDWLKGHIDNYKEIQNAQKLRDI